MKKLRKWLLISTLLLGLTLLTVNPVIADDVIDEFAGEPIVAYGGTLSDVQRDEVRKLLDVTSEKVHELDVTGADLAHYFGGNPNANMYSSVKITHKKPGHGIVINIITADNITLVTSEMYANALLTAGVENALIEVASPVKVTGESALTGIYKAFEVSGEGLDEERMQIANEEMNLTTNLSEKEGLSQEKVSELMTEIKKAIGDKKPATREEVEAIVKEQLDKLEIELSEADRQLLVDLFNKIKDLNIDFSKVKDQLNEIGSTIKDKLNDLDLEIDTGFFEKVKNFFKGLFETIGSWFS